MTLRAVKLSLLIQDHLEQSHQQTVCFNARYDQTLGQLSYEEQDQTLVKIDFAHDVFSFKRLGETPSILQLIHRQYANFSVGSPALTGQSWLEAYHVDSNSLQLHYQLYLDQSLITDRTLIYTITEADA